VQRFRRSWKARREVLDLETPVELLDRLTKALRRIEHNLLDVVRLVDSAGQHEIADQLSCLAHDVDRARAVPEALRGRDEFRVPLKTRNRRT
jgi:hypothetical protein